MYRLIDLSPAFTRGHVSSYHNREAAAKLSDQWAGAETLTDQSEWRLACPDASHDTSEFYQLIIESEHQIIHDKQENCPGQT